MNESHDYYILRIMTNGTEEHVTKVVDDEEYIQDVRDFFKGLPEMKHDPMWFIYGTNEIPKGFKPSHLPHEGNGLLDGTFCAEKGLIVPHSL